MTFFFLFLGWLFFFFFLSFFLSFSWVGYSLFFLFLFFFFLGWLFVVFFSFSFSWVGYLLLLVFFFFTVRSSILVFFFFNFLLASMSLGTKKKLKKKKATPLTGMGPQIVWKILNDENWVMMPNGCENLSDELWVMSDKNWVIKKMKPNNP